MESLAWTLFALAASVVATAAGIRAWRRARRRRSIGGLQPTTALEDRTPEVQPAASEPYVARTEEVQPPLEQPGQPGGLTPFTASDRPTHLPPSQSPAPSPPETIPAATPSAARGEPDERYTAPSGAFEIRLRLPSFARLAQLWPAGAAVWLGSMDHALFALALTVYAAIHVIRLTDFPIYFFTDEAVQTVLAADFIRDGFRDFLGHYFPTYFQNVYAFNLNLSVYAQVVPYLVLGKSVDVTRGTAALLTLPGAMAVGLTLRDVFRARYWWLGVLLLSTAPAWFLHSRTAFETALMASLYACFLYLYLLYRVRSAKFLFPALVFAAAAFYTYSPGEIIVPGTGLVLLLIDWRYHWRSRRTIAYAIPLALLLALPYVRFQIQIPGKSLESLRMLDSIWARDVSLSEKLRFSIGNYLQGLNPGYWFFPNGIDLSRHVMKDYGHLMLWTLPFALAGLVMAVRRLHAPEYRILLASLLVIPLGGAVVGLGITRLLSFVVPATILTALAVDSALGWTAGRLPARAVALGTFAVLAGVNLSMLRDSLVNGPLWFRDYGVTMQYGASQVFGAVQDILRREPGTQVIVSPTWGNGIDVVKRFFIPDDAQVEVANADGFLTEKKDLNNKMIFVLTPSEYQSLLTNLKIANVRVDRVLPYPDGSPGFYFLRMSYSPQADALFEQERLERQKPVVETAEIGGQTVVVQHPLFDNGEIKNVFDGDPYTFARTYDANPAVLILTFPAPRRVSAIEVTTGSMDIALTVRLYAEPDSTPAEYSQTYRGLPQDPTVHLAFPEAPPTVIRMEIDIGNAAIVGPSKLHLREIRLD